MNSCCWIGSSPRSAFYSLKLAEHSLEELMRGPSDRTGTGAEARRLLGRARSELEFVRPGALLGSLENRLAGLQATCRDVGEALSLRYFRFAPWVEWSDASRSTGSVSSEIEKGEH